MDFAAHALYGAVCCSRSGLAGGLRGAGKPVLRDVSVWTAAGWGVLPDVISMGVPMFLFLVAGGGIGPFFRDFDGSGLVLYRTMHSLLVAGAVVLTLRLWRRSLFVPSLAWPLHLVTDALTHDLGKFRTTLFYPLTDWAFEGWSWWTSRTLMLAYWAAPLAVLAVLAVLRRIHRSASGKRCLSPGGTA